MRYIASLRQADNEIADRMKIRFNRIIVSLPVLLAGILGAVMLYAWTKGVRVPTEGFIYILLLLALSVPMYFIPYIKITDTEIIACNQFGIPRRKRPINGLQDLKFEGTTLMVRSGDGWNKFYFSKIMSDLSDLKALKKAIQS